MTIQEVSELVEDYTGSWNVPVSGDQVDINYIVKKIKSNSNYTVHVGTDSHRPKGGVSHNFATVICLYEQGQGADYYFRRTTRNFHYKNLKQRMMEEVSQSIDVSIELMKYIPNNRIVVHADVNSDDRFPTFTVLNQIRSWVSSMGFNFRCKPDAWASSGVADKHAK